MDQQDDENAVSFLDHVAERHEILTALQAAEYKNGSPDSPPTRLPPHVFTLDAWVALYASPYDRLNQLGKAIQGNGVYNDEMIVCLALLSHVPDLIAMVQGSNVRSVSEAEAQANEAVQDVAHERDGYRCVLLRTVDNETAHIMPPRKNPEDLEKSRRQLTAFTYAWGMGHTNRYVEALSVEALGGPRNTLTLHADVRRAWDAGTIALVPVVHDESGVTVRVRFLYRRTGRARRFRWRGDLGAEPGDVLRAVGAREPYLDVACFEGRRRICEGDEFTIRSGDPELRPDPDLLDLRARVQIMASLRAMIKVPRKRW